MNQKQPELKELRSVIYVYADGSQYEMLDVKNYIDNLQSSGGLIATHSYISMKPIRWRKRLINFKPKI